MSAMKARFQIAECSFDYAKVRFFLETAKEKIIFLFYSYK